MSKKIIEEKAVGKSIPEYADENWGGYVLSLLTPDELLNGLPKANGLRRVLNYVFDVISSSSKEIILKESNEVLINWVIEFLPRKQICFDPSSHTLPVKTVTGFASASYDNVKPPFNKYLAAVADTRAEARAMRKALLLNCIAAEEAEEHLEESATTDLISDNQKTIAKTMSDRLKVNLEKTIAYYSVEITGKEGAKLDSLSRVEANKVLAVLNKFQANTKTPIPQEILER